MVLLLKRSSHPSGNTFSLKQRYALDLVDYSTSALFMSHYGLHLFFFPSPLSSHPVLSLLLPTIKDALPPDSPRKVFKYFFPQTGREKLLRTPPHKYTNQVFLFGKADLQDLRQVIFFPFMQQWNMSNIWHFKFFWIFWSSTVLNVIFKVLHALCQSFGATRTNSDYYKRIFNTLIFFAHRADFHFIFLHISHCCKNEMMKFFIHK